jgi:aldehyde:ferredoxin oxidoreductase
MHRVCGKDHGRTHARAAPEHGPGSRVRRSAPAGENCVVYDNVVCAARASARRQGGIGAILGSKNCKPCRARYAETRVFRPKT